MVYLTLVSDDGETVTYDYMPEREDAPKGTVTVSRSFRHVRDTKAGS